MSAVLAISWTGDNPSIATFYNTRTGFSKQFPLWKRNLSTKVETVLKNKKLIQQLVAQSDEIVVFEYKRFLDYFGVQDSGHVYDYPAIVADDLNETIAFITQNESQFINRWTELRAKAAVVYHHLESRGLRCEHQIIRPKYGMDVYSGRSKTLGEFSVQGMQADWNVRHVHSAYNIMIHFDWISADLRIAAIMSQDQEMLNCFSDSDPYAYIEKCLDGAVSRDQCKLEFVRAIYSLSQNSEIFKVYPQFAAWMADQVTLMRQRGYTESILGRRFTTDKTLTGDRRAFNSIMQGSVAHALQNVISRVSEECGDIIMTEQHDSLTIATNEDMSSNICSSGSF